MYFEDIILVPHQFHSCWSSGVSNLPLYKFAWSLYH